MIKKRISKKKIDKAIIKVLSLDEKLDAITIAFEKENWVQNEYWEEDEGIMCASFINIELDQLSVFISKEEQ